MFYGMLEKGEICTKRAYLKFSLQYAPFPSFETEGGTGSSYRLCAQSVTLPSVVIT